MADDKELLDAWGNAFDKPIYFDHKPTEEELLLIRLKAVVAIAKSKEREKVARKVCLICDEYNFGTQNCNLTGEEFCEAVLVIADQILEISEEGG